MVTKELVKTEIDHLQDDSLEMVYKMIIDRKEMPLIEASNNAPIQEHTLTLQDEEFKLVRTIRRIGGSHKEQDALIERLIQEIETLFAQQTPKEPIKWLEKGKRTGLPPFQPVTPEPDSPLASDIIIAQRMQATEQAEWEAFVDRYAGCLCDAPITRGDQGVYEIREELR